MTHAKFHFNWLMLTLIFGIWASEPPPRAWRTTEKAGPDRVNVLSKYIEEKINLDQGIITMSTLMDRYEELLVEEGLADEVKSYRTEKLKARIIKMFGEQVGFWHPKNRSKSEIIYSDLLPKGQII